MIPILNEAGAVVQVYGRKLLDNLRKGTPLHTYLPGSHRGVWNLEALKESKEIILAKSLIDALTFWCAGYRNVTAAYGVDGFTQDHLEAFKRHGTQRVLIAFDWDEVGDPDSYGHSSLIISRGGRSVAYDFGRYAGGHPSNALMKMFGAKNTGPGILRKWKNGDAYLKDQSKNRDQTVYTLKTSKAEEAAITQHFDQMAAEGQKKGDNSRFSTVQGKDDYGILTNSCVTQSAGPLAGAVGTKDGEEGFSTGQSLMIKTAFSTAISPGDVRAAGEALTAAGLATKQEIKKQEPKKKEAGQ